MKQFSKSSLVLLITMLVSISSMAEEKSRFQELELFNKVLYLVESSYYREVDTEKLIEGAIKGMLGTLDPHSAYLAEESFKKMQDETSGSFGCLGLEITSRGGYIFVIAPIDDGPAHKAGILSGDKIIEINGESTLGLTLQEAVERMKGEKNKEVMLGISRGQNREKLDFKLKRANISLKTVRSQLID